MGGIGYTNVYPVERISRDLRLASIWTGSNEVMAMIIASEWYQLSEKERNLKLGRNFENDAEEAFVEGEKIFE